MSSTIIEQEYPYDIVRRGNRDAAKHNKKVQEALKKQLKDVISQQDIITSESNKKVKVRLKYLDSYVFRHSPEYLNDIRRDEFDELEEGEILHKPSKDDGQGNNGDSDMVYETEYTISDLTKLLIEDLNLPDLDETKKNEIVSQVVQYDDLRKKTGIFSLIDKKRTLLANLKRKAKEKIPKEETCPISNEDLIFKTWSVRDEKHSNAVIFLMMDKSGSMSTNKIYAVKALYFWIVQFIKLKYKRVEIRFIAHDTQAQEVNEKEFFSIADGGGTSISYAFELCKDIITHNYSSSSWNIYCFYASDGDTWGDEDKCVTLVEDIVNLGANLFAYSEVRMDDHIKDSESPLYRKLANKQSTYDEIIVSSIENNEDIIGVLQLLLKKTVRRKTESVA